MIRRFTAVLLCLMLLITCSMGAYADTLFDQINAEQEEAGSDAALVVNAFPCTLRSDNAIASMIDGVYCVLGRDIARSEIEEIRFINNVDEIGLYAWDVSEARDGSIYAWVTNGTLVIAAEGVIKAPSSCAYMFAFYKNLKSISFNGLFDTTETYDMTGMFAGCEKLKEIDLNSLNVSNVVSMVSMFESCSSLEKVHASSWDLNSNLDSTNIFNDCKKLGFDTIDGIMYEKFEAMEAEAAEIYPPLKVGDRSDTVADMQNRLMTLGYAISKPDGIYGKKTAVAVHAFKADHKVFDGSKHDETECVASGLMLQALYAIELPGFDKNPGANKSSPLPLKISEEDSIESEELANNELQLSFTLNNTGDRAITAYTLSAYATDADGSKLCDPIAFAVESAIGANASAKSGSVILPDRGKIANVQVGVEKVSYEDGTEDTAADINYICFSAVDWLDR